MRERIFRMYTNTEMFVILAGGSIGTAISWMLGGLDLQIQSLLWLVLIDYASGMVAAWKAGELNSSKGFKVLLKKFSYFVVIAFMHSMDHGIGFGTAHILRNFAICGFVVNEGLSIIENIDKLGWGEYIPYFLRDKIEKIRTEKGVEKQ